MMEQHDEYRRIARIYDPVLTIPLYLLRKNINRILVDGRAGSVIDICCGTGQQARMLHKRGITVTGVDLSEAMIKRAKKKGPAGILYRLEDATELSFGENSFDAAVISLALHEKPVETSRAIVREAKRVVKPGGSLVIADYCIPKGIFARLRSVPIRLAEASTDAEHYANFRIWMSIGALQGFLADLGLECNIRRCYSWGNIALVTINA